MGMPTTNFALHHWGMWLTAVAASGGAKFHAPRRGEHFRQVSQFNEYDRHYVHSIDSHRGCAP